MFANLTVSNQIGDQTYWSIETSGLEYPMSAEFPSSRHAREMQSFDADIHNHASIWTPGPAHDHSIVT